MIYVGQTKLTIQLETLTDLSNISSVSIYYIKPSGTTGHWNGTVSGTKIIYIIQNNDLNEQGSWVIWAYVVFSDNKIGVGETVKMIVKNQGTL